MVEADDPRKFFDFQTSRYAIMGNILLNFSQKRKTIHQKYLEFKCFFMIFIQLIYIK